MSPGPGDVSRSAQATAVFTTPRPTTGQPGEGGPPGSPSHVDRAALPQRPSAVRRADDRPADLLGRPGGVPPRVTLPVEVDAHGVGADLQVRPGVAAVEEGHPVVLDPAAVLELRSGGGGRGRPPPRRVRRHANRFAGSRPRRPPSPRSRRSPYGTRRPAAPGAAAAPPRPCRAPRPRTPARTPARPARGAAAPGRGPPPGRTCGKRDRRRRWTCRHPATRRRRGRAPGPTDGSRWQNADAGLPLPARRRWWE